MPDPTNLFNPGVSPGLQPGFDEGQETPTASGTAAISTNIMDPGMAPGMQPSLEDQTAATSPAPPGMQSDPDNIMDPAAPPAMQPGFEEGGTLSPSGGNILYRVGPFRTSADTGTSTFTASPFTYALGSRFGVYQGNDVRRTSGSSAVAGVIVDLYDPNLVDITQTPPGSGTLTTLTGGDGKAAFDLTLDQINSFFYRATYPAGSYDFLRPDWVQVVIGPLLNR